jgi:hypothetical protein
MEMLSTHQMFLNFRSKIEPTLDNRPQITLSLTTRQPKYGADLECTQYWKGYASARKREICTCILQSGCNKFKNPVDDIDPDDS